MCGRFTLNNDLQELQELLPDGTEFYFSQWQPNYNAAPSQYLPVLYQQDGRKLDLFHWGLIPSWSKDRKIAFKLINARSETVSEKPSFRQAFRDRRALIPMNGWYEWARNHGQKQPYYHHAQDNPLIMAAGLREYWTDKSSGEQIQSFTMLTQQAYDQVADVHHRMPVLISPEHYADWLNPAEHHKDHLNQLITDQPKFDIELYPVSTRMNNARYQDPDCMSPYDLFS